MKKVLYLTLFSFGFTSILFAQTIRRVNNNFGVTGVNVYSTIQAAHDAAVANDVLLIEPSVTSYGNLTITKPLKIYGNGYFLDVNTELKADRRNSQVGDLYFDTGSDSSEVYGLYASYLYVYGSSNIKIARTRASYAYIYNRNQPNNGYANVSNIFIQNSYLSGVYASPTGGYTISGVYVKNNILDYIAAGSSPEIQNWIVSNNTFTWSNGIQLANSVFENNLLLYHKTLTFDNTTASYNVSAGATFNGGIGNVDNFAVSGELTGGGTGISPDEEVRIIDGSTLKTIGNAGTEVGAFGGSTPYVISGVPPIPAVLNMTNSGTGDGSNPLNVTISVKSNN